MADQHTGMKAQKAIDAALRHSAFPLKIATAAFQHTDMPLRQVLDCLASSGLGEGWPSGRLCAAQLHGIVHVVEL